MGAAALRHCWRPIAIARDDTQSLPKIGTDEQKQVVDGPDEQRRNGGRLNAHNTGRNDGTPSVLTKKDAARRLTVVSGKPSQWTTADRLALAELGRRIHERREQLLLTRTDVAERVGTKSTYVADVENGKRNLGVVNLTKIAAALGLDTGDLVRGLGRKPRKRFVRKRA